MTKPLWIVLTDGTVRRSLQPEMVLWACVNVLAVYRYKREALRRAASVR